MTLDTRTALEQLLDHLANLVAERVATVVEPRPAGEEPWLWSVRTASSRSGLPKEVLYRAYHSGAIRGIKSGEGSNAPILLEPEGVRQLRNELLNGEHQSVLRKDMAKGKTRPG